MSAGAPFPHCGAAHGASGGPRAGPEGVVRFRPRGCLACVYVNRQREQCSVSGRHGATADRRKRDLLISWWAAMWASGPAAAARPVEAGLGPARDGWPPTSALALLVKMAAVAIAATKVQAYSAQAPVVFRLLSHFAHARAARPASLREGMSLFRMSLPRFDPAAKSCSLEPWPTLPSAIAAAAVELSRRLVPDMLPPCR